MMIQPTNRASALCWMMIASLSFASLKSFAQPSQTAAPPTAQTSEAPKPAEYGSIEGVVIDPGGKPVKGAWVCSIGDVEGKLPLSGRWPPGPCTTSDTEGKFVLGSVVVDNPVRVYASKESDYYEDVSQPFVFNLPKNLKIMELEVKPGQTITGITIRLSKKAGRVRLNVRDAETRELVHGVFMQCCRKGYPNNCINGSGPSDYERLISLGVGISIKIEADDGLHETWQYRNPKTGSPYFRAKSGETETVTVYLHKKRDKS
jgi:hypothetical protein